MKDFTQAIIDSRELDGDTKKETAEQLEFLVAQLIADKQNRSIGLVKGIFAGIKDTISVSAGLLTIWDKLTPLLRLAFGI